MQGNLAARAGRWSAAHWKTATFGWLALVLAAVVAGSVAGTKVLTDAENANGQSAKAERILAHAGFDNSAGESVIVQSKSGAPPGPVAADVSAMLRARSDVKKVKAPVRSKDGHSMLVQFELTGNADTADGRVQPVLNAVAAVQRAHSGFLVAEFGDASANHALNETTGKDFSKAERLSVPLTFLILLLAFGAFVAAGIPVLLALSAVLASLGISSLVSHVAHAATATSSVILLIGMAVGVDYSLFYVKREREERAAGRAGRDALHRAAATSGQAVLVSGATVMVAMAGMLLAGSAVFTSVGLGAMIVVFCSVVGSLTVLPALLAKLGDRIDRGVIAVSAAGVGRVLRHEPRVVARLRARRDAHPAPERHRRRVAGVARDPATVASLPGGRDDRLGRVPGGARPAGVRHARKAPQLQRPASQPEDRADLRDDAEGVPGLVVARDRRRAGAERRGTGVQSAVASLRTRALATGVDEDADPRRP